MIRIAKLVRCAQTARIPLSAALRRFSSHDRGDIAMMFGLTLTVMCLVTGAAVDIGRWMQARQETLEAIDAAVLAGLKKYQDTNDEAAAILTAQINYAYNIGQRSPVMSDTIGFKLLANNTEMTATGDVTIATPFLGIGSVSSLPLLKTDGSELAVSKMAVGANTGTSLEIAIMIDNTGSMTESDYVGSTKIEDVKSAAAALVDQVIWADQGSYTSKIALIPFAATVNLGSVSLGDLAHGKPARGPDSACVTERTGSQAYTDASPISYPVGLDPRCTIAAPLVPLTNDKTALHASINAMTANGATAGHLGTAWSWYALSPNFNELWPSSSNAARPYSDLSVLNGSGQPVLKKVAILMTDGDYNTQYSANGSSNAQAAKLCTAMKAEGIEVYTIGAQVSATAKAFLTACATDSQHYYDATNGTLLLASFNDITKKLIKPFLTH